MHRIIIATALYLMALGCQAAIVTWTVENAEYSGPIGTGFIEGTFDYDADLNQYSNVNLTDTQGFTNGFLGASGNASGLNVQYFYLNEATFTVNLEFASQLTNSGGDVSLVLSDLPTGSAVYFCCTGANFISGSVTAVPVPAALWFFISGLFVLRCFRQHAVS